MRTDKEATGVILDFIFLGIGLVCLAVFMGIILAFM